MTMPDAAGAASCPATRAPTADERIPTRTATESDRRFIYAPLRRLTAPILATKDAKPHVFHYVSCLSRCDSGDRRPGSGRLRGHYSPVRPPHTRCAFVRALKVAAEAGQVGVAAGVGDFLDARRRRQ